MSNEEKTVYPDRSQGVAAGLEKLEPALQRKLYAEAAIEQQRFNKSKTTMQSRMAYIKSLHLKIDSISNKRNGPDVKCTRGCSFCCYQPVEISLIEAQLLVKHVMADPDLIPQMYEQTKKPGWPLWKTLPHEKRKCVFLKNNECSVYADRPINCRKLFVVSDPKECDLEKEYPKVESIVDFQIEMLAAVPPLEGYGNLPDILLYAVAIEQQNQKANGKV